MCNGTDVLLFNVQTWRPDELQRAAEPKCTFFKDKSSRSVYHTRISRHFFRSVRPSPANYGESPFFSPLTSQVKPNSVFPHAPRPRPLRIVLLLSAWEIQAYSSFHCPKEKINIISLVWRAITQNDAGAEVAIRNAARKMPLDHWDFLFSGGDENNREECSIQEIKVCKIWA